MGYAVPALDLFVDPFNIDNIMFLRPVTPVTAELITSNDLIFKTNSSNFIIQGSPHHSQYTGVELDSGFTTLLKLKGGV